MKDHAIDARLKLEAFEARRLRRRRFHALLVGSIAGLLAGFISIAVGIDVFPPATWIVVAIVWAIYGISTALLTGVFATPLSLEGADGAGNAFAQAIESVRGEDATPTLLLWIIPNVLCLVGFLLHSYY